GKLAFRGWVIGASSIIHEPHPARVRSERPVPAMRGNRARVKPGLHVQNYEFPVSRGLLQLRAQSRGGLCSHDGIREVTIDLAKVFPPVRRQRLFAAGE